MSNSICPVCNNPITNSGKHVWELDNEVEFCSINFESGFEISEEEEAYNNIDLDTDIEDNIKKVIEMSKDK